MYRASSSNQKRPRADEEFAQPLPKQPSRHLVSRMPELAIGTALPTFLVENVVYDALKCGYRHIDTATRYADMPFLGPLGSVNRAEEFVGALRRGLIRGMKDFDISREKLWITLKGDTLDADLTLFGFEYVDCYIPSSRGKTLASPKVRFWGAENISCTETVPDEITIIQIQANREADIQGWIDRGLHVQLFSAISALNGGEPYAIEPSVREMVVQYFLTKYVREQGNTLIVGSQTGSSLIRNRELLNKPTSFDADEVKALMNDTIER
jgi:hypothetical protein